jgi:hypothetical protein
MEAAHRPIPYGDGERQIPQGSVEQEVERLLGLPARSIRVHFHRMQELSAAWLSYPVFLVRQIGLGKQRDQNRFLPSLCPIFSCRPQMLCALSPAMGGSDLDSLLRSVAHPC